MPVTASELSKFFGWMFMVFIPETGQRYAGPVARVETRESNQTYVFVDWMLSDYSDDHWLPAICGLGQPVKYWYGAFADWQSVQPYEDGAFVINHSPAEQILMFFPPDNHLYGHIWQAHDYLLTSGLVV